MSWGFVCKIYSIHAKQNRRAGFMLAQCAISNRLAKEAPAPRNMCFGGVIFIHCSVAFCSDVSEGVVSVFVLLLLLCAIIYKYFLTY